MRVFKMNKKIKILILSFVLSIIIFSLVSPYVARNIFIRAMTGLNLMKKCYKVDKDVLELFKQEGFNYLSEDKKVTDLGVKKLYDKRILSSVAKIPLISHHVYFTSKQNPKALNAYFENKLITSFSKLNNVNSSWKHFIWTNNKEIFPNNIKEIKGVELRSIEEFKDEALYPFLLKALEKGEKLRAYFSEGSDLTRFLAINRFGGMYNDMDYEIFNPEEMTKFFFQYDFIGARETVRKISYYASAFVAAKPAHPILQEIIKRGIRNYKLESAPSYIKYSCSEKDRISMNAPPLVTLSYFSKNNIDNNNDVIMPTWIIMNATFARYKNIDCNYDSVTKENFIKRESNLKDLLINYIRVAKEEGAEDDNIYYSIKNHADFSIVGADMFCGGWLKDGKKMKEKNIYWNF